jgi:hypothetical protein
MGVSIIPDDGGSTYLWNVGRQLFYTALNPRRQFWAFIFMGVSIIPADGDSTYLWNVGRQLFYTALNHKRQFWAFIFMGVSVCKQRDMFIKQSRHGYGSSRTIIIHGRFAIPLVQLHSALAHK